MGLSYNLIGDEKGAGIVVFVNGETRIAVESHPNFEAIVSGARAGDKSIADLFDIARTAAARFERLSERVTTANGALYLDGEEIHDALSAQVLRFLDEGHEDWRPLVEFFENVQANPSQHSRDQLYSWLAREDFTITAQGYIVGYKGVRATPEGFESIHSGRAIVDGEVHEGYIPNAIGAVVEMPRGSVAFDPGNGCSYGLHVGSHEYATGFARGATLEVHVNPRDVVSVPTDCGAQKMRVCRYLVVGASLQRQTFALAGGFDSSEYGDGDDNGEGWEEEDYSF